MLGLGLVNYRVLFVAGDENFMKNDIRVQKGLDGLGCLGDLGWYNIGWSLWAAGYDKPVSVAAVPGGRLCLIPFIATVISEAVRARNVLCVDSSVP